MAQTSKLDMIDQVRPDIIKHVRDMHADGLSPYRISSYLATQGVFATSEAVRRWLKANAPRPVPEPEASPERQPEPVRPGATGSSF